MQLGPAERHPRVSKVTAEAAATLSPVLAANSAVWTDN